MRLVARASKNTRPSPACRRRGTEAEEAQRRLQQSTAQPAAIREIDDERVVGRGALGPGAGIL